MKEIIFIVAMMTPGFKSFAQLINDSIGKEFIRATVNYLASDKLGGRANFSEGQRQAADFISNEFKNYGLRPFEGQSAFQMPFQVSGHPMEGAKLLWNGRAIHDSLFVFIPGRIGIPQRSLDDFIILQALFPVSDSILLRYWAQSESNTLIWIILPDSISFKDIKNKIIFPPVPPKHDILIVAAKDEPEIVNLGEANIHSTGSALFNVVGMLPGTTLSEEVVIFSAHYDHVDNGLDGKGGDVFNGANDNASGTTAVLTLARYFARRRDNKRTVLFCLFAGEEIGLLGSKAFVRAVNPGSIKAVINIEMIGATNAVGRNEFMVTGGGYSDLADILKKNLKQDKVKVTSLNDDPRLLFERSDNYPFALKGIPAHTIMCSDDKEECYHKPCDDAERLDIDNMTKIIRAIAKGCLPIIEGSVTPKRKN